MIVDTRENRKPDTVTIPRDQWERTKAAAATAYAMLNMVTCDNCRLPKASGFTHGCKGEVR